MRKKLCVPMMLLLLLLSACGRAENEDEAVSLREPYQTMTGCIMEADISCSYETMLWEGTLKCDYVPDGMSTIQVVSPGSIAGVRAVLSEEGWQLEFEDLVLPVGTLGESSLSPMTCLPRLMHALREGWLLEENEETWLDEPCLRMKVDETAEDGRKVISTIWLRKSDGTPLRGEIALGEEIILTAEFTSFTFYDKIEQQSAQAG